MKPTGTGSSPVGLRILRSGFSAKVSRFFAPCLMKFRCHSTGPSMSVTPRLPHTLAGAKKNCQAKPNGIAPPMELHPIRAMHRIRNAHSHGANNFPHPVTVTLIFNDGIPRRSPHSLQAPAPSAFKGFSATDGNGRALSSRHFPASNHFRFILDIPRTFSMAIISS